MNKLHQKDYQRMSRKTDLEKSEWILPITIFSLILIIWIATGLILVDVEDRGTLGDMFGTTNALFSGLAFGGVIYAILLQRRDLNYQSMILKNQNEEIKLNREELEGQKEQLALQNETLKRQNFEATFFKLLSLHNEITSKIKIEAGDGRTYIGIESFEYLYTQYQEIWTQYQNKDDEDLNTSIKKTFKEFYDQHHLQIGHYYRSLQYLMTQIYENRNFLDNDGRLYSNLVRSHLSRYELCLLFYDALSDAGSDRLKQHIEYFSIFSAIDKQDLIDANHYINLYNSTAYGNLENQ